MDFKNFFPVWDKLTAQQQDKLRATIDNNTKSIEALQGVVQELAALVKGMKKEG